MLFRSGARILGALRQSRCRLQSTFSQHSSSSSAMSPPSSPPSEESEATTDPILVERRALAGTKGGYLLVTLNRPRHSNAMNNATLQELQAVFDRLPADKWVRAVVLTGAGHAFCGGHDLYQMHDSQGDKQYFERMFARCSRFMLSIQRVPQPVLAAVNGLATGAGCQLVAACDLAIASSHAQFATSGVKLGLFCATPSVPLSRNLSRKRAFEMLVTGKYIQAEKALDWGLVNSVCAHEELEATVLRLVTEIAQNPPVAISMGKRLFYSQLEKSSIAGAYDMADYVMSTNMTEADTEEGIAAFVEKRPPTWNL